MKSRSRITTLVEVLSPILLMSIMVYAYSLVEPQQLPQHVYANQTAELVYNFSRDAAASQLASDLRLCAAILPPPEGIGVPHQQPPDRSGGAQGQAPAPASGDGTAQPSGQSSDGAMVPPGRRLRQQAAQRQGGASPAGAAVSAGPAAGDAGAAAPPAYNLQQDPVYLDWLAMMNPAANDPGPADPQPQKITDPAPNGGTASEPSRTASLPAANPPAYNLQQDPAYLAWVAMMSPTADDSGSAGPQPEGVLDPVPDRVPGHDPGAIPVPAADPPAPSLQQDPEYLAWLAMMRPAANDASAPAASVGAGAPLSDQVVDNISSAPQGGLPENSNAPQVPPADGDAAVAPSGQASPGLAVDWTRFLTPSVLAAALKLAKNPLDTATWQLLLQSGDRLSSLSPFCRSHDELIHRTLFSNLRTVIV